MKEHKSRVIAVSGANGIGKSVFSTLLSKNVEKENNKILLVDFDLERNYIQTILRIKSCPQHIEDVKSMIVNIDSNLDVLYNLNLFFPYTDNVNYFTLQKMLLDLRKEYNLIIIDTSSSINNEYTRKIFDNSDKIIFLIEPNILGIKKAESMLEVIENDWKIPCERINIVLNKANTYDISKNVLQELFADINIIGEMKYSDGYNLLINKNIDKKEINEEYKRIYKKIE